MVSRLSQYLETHRNLHFPHRHSFSHFVLFTQGQGTYSIDFEKFPVSPNQIYFMVPGQVHSWSFTGETEGYIVNFSRGFFYSFLLRPEYLGQFPFLTGAVEESVITLPGNIMQEVVPTLEAIILEDQQRAAFDADMVRVLLLRIFLSVNRLLVKKSDRKLAGAKMLVVRNFQSLVEQHYSDIRLPKDYAALLYVTPNHLNALCKDMLGKPAGELIRERVLLEAKRLLTDGGLSVSGIASRLNFNDNSYFTKFFKKYTALTPEEFRGNIFRQQNNRT